MVINMILKKTRFMVPGLRRVAGGYEMSEPGVKCWTITETKFIGGSGSAAKLPMEFLV